jgi:hypothetical protein
VPCRSELAFGTSQLYSASNSLLRLSLELIADAA